MMFDSSRLVFAMRRRGMTGKALSETVGVTVQTITRLRNQPNSNPNPETLRAIADALRYPVDFFLDGEIEFVEPEQISFRSLKAMKKFERHSAIAAASIGLVLADWVSDKFNLPECTIPDQLRDTRDPAAAARSLRQFWGIGEKPISSVIGLLESHGVRVFSLEERTNNVDAYSFWRDDRPYIFLNTLKTPERSVFNVGHELGHLVLHRYGSTLGYGFENSEREADIFASEFLMPALDVRANAPKRITVDSIIRTKKRWKVSAMALAKRLKDNGRLTEWQYRSISIELTKRGYRTGEPHGIIREKSILWEKVLRQLWKERITRTEIARELNLPEDELNSLLFGLLDSPASNLSGDRTASIGLVNSSLSD